MHLFVILMKPFILLLLLATIDCVVSSAPWSIQALPIVNKFQKLFRSSDKRVEARNENSEAFDYDHYDHHLRQVLLKNYMYL